jgi:hypothetical protein
MAHYKDPKYLIQNNDVSFDQDHSPGVAAPFAGISVHGVSP